MGDDRNFKKVLLNSVICTRRWVGQFVKYWHWWIKQICATCYILLRFIQELYCVWLESSDNKTLTSYHTCSFSSQVNKDIWSIIFVYHVFIRPNQNHKNCFCIWKTMITYQVRAHSLHYHFSFCCLTFLSCESISSHDAHRNHQNMLRDYIAKADKKDEI